MRFFIENWHPFIWWYGLRRNVHQKYKMKCCRKITCWTLFLEVGSSEADEKSTPSCFNFWYKLGIRLNWESPLNSPSAQDFRSPRNFSWTLGWVRPRIRLNSFSNSRLAISNRNSLPQLLAHASSTYKKIK